MGKLVKVGHFDIEAAILEAVEFTLGYCPFDLQFHRDGTAMVFTREGYSAKVEVRPSHSPMEVKINTRYMGGSSDICHLNFAREEDYVSASTVICRPFYLDHEKHAHR